MSHDPDFFQVIAMMLNDTTAGIHPMVKIKDQWARPVVDASRGNLRTMMGRMDGRNEVDNDLYYLE